MQTMSSRNIGTDLAPALKTTRWFNMDGSLSLDDLHGRVVVLLAFQMLCPGCVARSIPLAQKMQQMFENRNLVVIGLHTVFEHHDVMTPNALEVFLSEYRVSFPVGVDTPNEHGGTIPQTMEAYQMQGTPTWVLIDVNGRRRGQYFGSHDELALGVEIGALLSEMREPVGKSFESVKTDSEHCDSNGCQIGES
ncbi:MAG: hypothetical protein DHS20C01_09510 [marine bacterium B5-7]|nr:MAG: hypothetical protein DHS20C01_09510 [marine bacterium B5-7]